MLSYQNDPALKVRFVAHVERHRVEDRLLQGLYGGLVDGEWKGCAVGCALRSLDEIDGKTRTAYQDHEALSERLGVPLWLTRLEDSIFEGLAAEEAKLWPTRLANAMPVGRDLESVWPKLAHWLLVDPAAGVLRHARGAPSKKAIRDVAALYQRWIDGAAKPDQGEWLKARSAASAYAAYAASAYAYADASASAADAYAYAAYARKTHWKLISEKLCELLAAA